jgi:hypothetical protein
MFTRSEGDAPPVIDAVVGVEGKFQFHPGVDVAHNIELTMMYCNSKTKVSFGTVSLGPNNWSKETLSKFQEFMTSAEKDFGEVLFKGGVSTPYGPSTRAGVGKAETGEGIPKTLGGT